MGTYLATGITQQITIDKRDINYSDITIDKIAEKLKDEINLDFYDYSEDSKGWYWKIKPKKLEDNLVGFLTQQFKMYQSKTDSYMQKVIDKLEEITNGEEIIELAESATLINFQLVDQLIDYVTVERNNGFKENIMTSYSLIAYFMDGKIMTEGLGNSLRYFETNIRMQRDKYPIADCIKILVTS